MLEILGRIEPSDENGAGEDAGSGPAGLDDSKIM